MGASNEYPKHAKVSINIYMNECVESEDQLDGTNFTGGAIRFRHAKYEHKPKMGTAVIYPANYIGTHEVTPVTGGIRVAYLGSFLYGSPENSSPNDSRIWMKNLKEDCNFFQRKI
jgi:predicted 2-oxoglutarate/Fe(II)-dependent dioxygenase YbiX